LRVGVDGDNDVGLVVATLRGGLRVGYDGSNDIVVLFRDVL